MCKIEKFIYATDLKFCDPDTNEIEIFLLIKIIHEFFLTVL